VVNSLTYFSVSGDFYNVTDPTLGDVTNVPQVQIIEGLVTFYPRLPKGFVAYIDNYVVQPAVSEIQVFSISGALSGTFTLSYQGQTTSTIPYNAAATTVQSALRALSTIGAGNVSVAGSAGGPYTITFTGSLANTPVGLISADTSALVGVTPTISTATITTSQVAVNEVQRVTITGSPTSGWFYLTFAGHVTGPIPYNATAIAVQQALQALPSIGSIPGGEWGSSANVVVTGSNGGPYDVTFVGQLAAQDVPTLITRSSFGGGSTPGVSVSTVTTGLPRINEVQTVTITNARSGFFTLTLAGHTTAPIGWNSPWYTVRDIIAALPGVGAGNVAVTGPLNGVYTIAFGGTLAGTDMPQITANGSLLVGLLPNSTLERTATGTSQVARDSALAIPQRNGRIWNGQLSTIDISDTTDVQLVSNTAPLGLAARGIPSLIYDVKFSQVTYAKNSQVISDFAFTAPTDSTPICITDPALNRLDYLGP
jgi:hypothetical protein